MATDFKVSKEEAKRREAEIARLDALPVKTERGRKLVALRKRLIASPDESMTIEDIRKQIQETRS